MRASFSLEPRGPSETPSCLPSELGHGPWTWRWFWLPHVLCGDQLQVRRRGGLGSARWAGPPPEGGPQVVSNAERLPTSTEGGHCNAGPRMLWGSFSLLHL